MRTELERFVERTGADEVIVSSHIYDHGARLRSYQIAAEIGAHLRGVADKETDQTQPRRR